jgi:ribonuclease BN (tRNA processing enzyme)
MKLTIVGCSGSLPGPDSAASAYLVEHEGVRLLLDLGSGALGPLQRHVDPADLDAIVLTHLHADHCLDMCGMVVARRYRPPGKPPPVPVLAPAGGAARIAAAYGPDQGLQDVFTFADLVAGHWEIGPFELQVARVNHPVETYAVRVSAGGKSLTYSADTGRSKALVELARGSDLLLCEATFPDGADTPPDVHLTGREAGEHAERAGVARLLLTHIPPWGDRIATLGEACSAFGGMTEVAVAGAVFELK